MTTDKMNCSNTDKKVAISQEKAGCITSFLHEYGEQASWDDWLAFLHRRQLVADFKWTLAVD